MCLIGPDFLYELYRDPQSQKASVIKVHSSMLKTGPNESEPIKTQAP